MAWVYADLRLVVNKVAQEQRAAVRIAQLARGCVEVRGNVFPSSAGFGSRPVIHGGGLRFMGSAPHIGTNGVGGEVLGRAMQPTGQDGVLGELSSTSRQREKHALRHILSQVRIPDNTQGSGIDEINMVSDQFAERSLRAELRVFSQQLLVGQTVHS